MADALTTYEPVILLEIQLDGGTQYVATKDYYYSGQKYRSGLLNVTVNQQLPNVFYGVIKQAGFKARLFNVDDGVNQTWDELAASEEFRGRWCKATRYDPTDGADVIGYGKISEVNFGDEVEIYVGMDANLEKKVPSLITTDDFPATQLDPGKPINICFGKCYDVPCWNIQNNTTDDHYDYLIGHGPIEGINSSFANNLGVKRDGQIVATAEYTAYTGTQATHNGYAFIRFDVEQRNFSGGMHRINADVLGLEITSTAACERNFIRVIEAFLSNTVWGLSNTVSTASFATAAGIISTGSSFFCDGAITDQRTAKAVLDDLLFPSRAYIERDSSGDWGITVDTTGGSIMTLGEADGQYENCHLRGGLRTIPTDEIVSVITVQYDHRE